MRARPGTIDAVLALGRSLAWSALAAGDAFGMLRFGERIGRGDVLAPTRKRALALAAVDALPRQPWTASSADGIAAVGATVGQARSVVFLVSDFLVPPQRLGQALDDLARHFVVPVRTWSPQAAFVSCRVREKRLWCFVVNELKPLIFLKNTIALFKGLDTRPR